jgi:CRISPR-associated protein Csd1
MILQSLYSLYTRKPELAQRGFAPMGISWVIVLTLEGKIAQIRDFKNNSGRGNKLIAQDLVVPTVGKRTSGDKPIFLCDKSDYVIGRNEDIEAKEGGADKLNRRFELFRELHEKAVSKIQHPHYEALVKFLNHWDPFSEESLPTLLKTSGRSLADLSDGNYAFQILGESGFIHDLEQTKTYWRSTCDDTDNAIKSTCLITGISSSIARLHPAIKGVIDPGGQSEKGIVVFNAAAFTSYGKEQSFTAPVSEVAAFGYCTALNHLLDSERQKFRIGDTTTVFWTDKPTAAEDLLSFWLDSGSTPEDAGLKQRLEALLEKAAQGQLATDDLGDATTRFYILGLAPNAARISIRFWHTGTLGELTANLQKHQNDLSIVRQWDETNSKNPDPKVPGVYALLRQTARDADGIPPLLGGALMRAILLGNRYPDALFQKVMGRLRAGEKDRNGNPTDRVTYLRAAILKAFLNRNHQKHIPMSLDPNRTETSYLLGRLFGVLEKTQEEAQPGINATIRDRFYSAASATPGTVFPRILRTYQHHLSKLEGEMKVNRERLVQDIVGSIQSFPSHMNLQDQGQFAIGYYHQRKDFFTKKATE